MVSNRGESLSAKFEVGYSSDYDNRFVLDVIKAVYTRLVVPA